VTGLNKEGGGGKGKKEEYRIRMWGGGPRKVHTGYMASRGEEKKGAVAERSQIKWRRERSSGGLVRKREGEVGWEGKKYGKNRVSITEREGGKG